MGLSAREVLIILRARDLASRDIAQVGLAFTELEGAARAAAMQHIQEGTALMGIGVAFGIAGAAGLKFYGDSLKAAVDYNKEVAYTATQVADGANKLQELGQIGVDVAAKIPAPFKEMQASLYDIFSSTDASIQQSEVLLEAFAKGAVAGQTDIQTAGRATISVMNAFKIPFEDVNHVMDVQFNTVKLGVITYEQLASTIGRAIPSAVRAGQSFEDLGGMIAFMTRNGLSAAQAATSAARALDMLANPNFKDNMDAFGISVTNADGAFRPMVDIVSDLKQKFGELAPAQRTLEFLRLGGEGSAAALKELGIQAYNADGSLRPFNDVSAELVKHFKGMSEEQVSQALAAITHGAGGTIQAMRFLNLAVGDSNNLYQSLTEQIRNSGGAAETAYQIMRKTPAMQVQLLANQWEIIKKQIGDGLIPVFSGLIGKLNDALHWFINLDDKTKNLIATIGLVISVFLTLTGIFTVMAGAVQVLAGLFELLGTGAILALGGWVTAAMAASGAILFLAAKTQFFQTVIKDVAKAYDAFMGGFENPNAINSANSRMISFGQNVHKVFDDIVTFIHQYLIPAFNLISDAFRSNGLAGAIKEAGSLFENLLLPQVVDGIHKVGAYLTSELPKLGHSLYDWITDVTPTVIDKISTVVDSIIQEFGKLAGRLIADFLPGLLTAFAAITSALVVYVVATLIPSVVKAFANLNGAIIDALGSISGGIGKAIADWLNLPDIFGPLISNARLLADIITGVLVVAFEALIVKYMALIALKIIDEFETLYLKALYAADGIKALIVAVQTFIAVNLVGFLETAYLKILYLGDAFLGAIVKVQAFIVASGGIEGALLRATVAVQSFVVANGGIAGLAAAAGPWALLAVMIGGAVYAVMHMNDGLEVSTAMVQRFVDGVNAHLPEAIQAFELFAKQGGDTKALFEGIANASIDAAQKIIDGLNRQGKSTKDYQDILDQVKGKHAEVGVSAQDAYQKAVDAARGYRNELDIQLGKLGDVSKAHDNLVLAIDAVNRQMQSNITSTDSLEVKQARLNLTQLDVVSSAANLVETFKKQAEQGNLSHDAVQAQIDVLNAFKDNNPAVADSVQAIIDKLQDLANQPNVNKTINIQTVYTSVADQNAKSFDTSEGGSREATGGVIGYALAQGGLVHAAMGVVTGFKTKGPTLVGEGNPIYPEFVIATDPAYRDRNVKLYSQAGHALNLYASGGVMGTDISEQMQGAVSAMRGAYSSVKSAAGDYSGIPGYRPSGEQMLMSLNDTASILAGLGGLPGGSKNTTLNIHEGAIRIDGSGLPPEVLGQTVEDALENFLRTLQMQ